MKMSLPRAKRRSAFNLGAQSALPSWVLGSPSVVCLPADFSLLLKAGLSVLHCPGTDRAVADQSLFRPVRDWLPTAHLPFVPILSEPLFRSLFGFWLLDNTWRCSGNPMGSNSSPLCACQATPRSPKAPA